MPKAPQLLRARRRARTPDSLPGAGKTTQAALGVPELPLTFPFFSLTFPEVLIPFAKEAYTITQARKRQRASGHLISPGYSIPAEIFSTKYLRVQRREVIGARWGGSGAGKRSRRWGRWRSAGFLFLQSWGAWNKIPASPTLPTRGWIRSGCEGFADWRSRPQLSEVGPTEFTLLLINYGPK